MPKATQRLTFKAPKIGSVQYVAVDKDPENPTSGFYFNRSAILAMLGRKAEPRAIRITVEIEE